MRQSKICATACCVISLIACASDYGFGKLPIPEPHRLPVESFPAVIGGWHAGPVLPVDADVQGKLPSAKIIERVYKNESGHEIDLTLVTAKDSLDIHDPSVCLPAQGWNVLSSTTAKYGDQTVHVLKLEQDGENLEAYYWWTGYYPPNISRHPWVRAAARVRQYIVHSRDGESLMVRILSNNDQNDIQTLNGFTQSVMPAVAELTSTVKQPTR